MISQSILKKALSNGLKKCKILLCGVFDFFVKTHRKSANLCKIFAKEGRKKMKEIIDSIKVAEAEAEKIIAQAKVLANKISNDAEAQVMQLDASVKEEIKDAKKQLSQKLTEETQELYDKRIALAKQEGEALKQSIQKNLQKTADFVAKRVIG